MNTRWDAGFPGMEGIVKKERKENQKNREKPFVIKEVLECSLSSCRNQ